MPLFKPYWWNKPTCAEPLPGFTTTVTPIPWDPSHISSPWAAKKKQTGAAPRIGSPEAKANLPRVVTHLPLVTRGMRPAAQTTTANALLALNALARPRPINAKPALTCSLTLDFTRTKMRLALYMVLNMEKQPPEHKPKLQNPEFRINTQQPSLLTLFPVQHVRLSLPSLDVLHPKTLADVEKEARRGSNGAATSESKTSLHRSP